MNIKGSRPSGKPRTWPVGSFRHPSGVMVVTDRTGLQWRRAGVRWTSDNKNHIRWYKLSSERGPLTEVMPEKDQT